MNFPLVSIIIPLYNAENHIAQTIESLLIQTWPNKEILIIDDGSTDKSRDIINSFDNEIIKLYTQENKGAAAARNLGIKRAKGKYIQFLDADDLLSKNKIEVQVNAIGNSKKLAVCSTVHFINGTNPYQQMPSEYEDRFLYSTDNSYEFLINLWGGNNQGASMIQTNAWLVPSKLINENELWQEFYSPDDDGEYFSRIILSSDGITYSPNCYNYYRKFASINSLSNRNSLRALEGCYRSIQCKQESLKDKMSDIRARTAISNQLHDILYVAYPNHNKLVKQIEADIKKLGIKSKSPSLGGKGINIITKIFGWKFSRYLQCFSSFIIKPLFHN